MSLEHTHGCLPVPGTENSSPLRPSRKRKNPSTIDHSTDDGPPVKKRAGPSLDPNMQILTASDFRRMRKLIEKQARAAQEDDASGDSSDDDDGDQQDDASSSPGVSNTVWLVGLAHTASHPLGPCCHLP